MRIQRWKQEHSKQVICSMIGVIACLNAGAVLAQRRVVVDSTLDAESSTVTEIGPNRFDINGGSRRGRNLFHSFREFGVEEGSQVYFSNPANVENIIGRVTGRSPSEIFGTLGVRGNANLFLLNPHGVIFGPNAVLDIRGSFAASTADRINFADGSKFSAAAPAAALLTISIPVGLQFGSHPGPIVVQGNGGGIRRSADLVDTPLGLQVQPNRTLALVGGDVLLQGATLKTPGGRIELGSVDQAGRVALSPTEAGWGFNYQDISEFGDIRLSQQSVVDASGLGGGEIRLRGRRVMLQDGSQIESSTLGTAAGSSVSIRATEAIELTPGSGNAPLLFTSVYPGATGAGGNLILETRRLIVQDGSQIFTATSGAGRAGDIRVQSADAVELVGFSFDAGTVFPSLLSTQVVPGATGRSGNLTLETRRLSLRNGGNLLIATSGAGAGGNIQVRASDAVELITARADGVSTFLSNLVRTGAQGNGGNLTISTQRLTVEGNASIQATTFGGGDAGDLLINAAELVELNRRGQIATSTLGAGTGGNLTIETGRLLIANGSQVQAGTVGPGRSGNIVVRASDAVELVGAVDPFSSAIVSSVQPGATGAGGNITLETRQLSLRDGASISAATLGQGTAGDVFINAADSVELIGATGQMPTNLTAQTQSSGNAGNLTLITNTLLIQDQAGLSVGSQGTGSAGNLTIDADTIALDRGIIAATTGGTGVQSGALINLRNLQLLTMENGSVISAQATDRANGGSISIEANEGLVVATPTENNDIIASADQGNGGNIDIRTQGIFGLQPSSIDTPNSDINASSRFGLDGVVQLDTSDANLTRGLTELPTDVVDASSQIAQTCPTNAADTQNEFIVTGRGGLPPNSLEVLDGDAIQVDLVTRNLPQPSDPDASSRMHLPDAESQPVVEAQGWIVDAKGEVMLTATAPTNSLSQSWMSSSNCFDQASESRL